MRTPRTGTGVRAAAMALAVVLTAAACSSGDGDPRAAGGGSPFFLGVRSNAPTLLREGQSCDQVLEDFQTFAPAVLRGSMGFGMEGESFTPVGGVLEDSAPTGVAVDEASGDGFSAAPASPESGRAADGGSSDTNTQEAGIDEPDTVENDGDFVYVVDQQELVILDGATAEVLSRLALASYGAQILLSGDRLLAISGGGGFYGGPMPVDDIAISSPPPATDEARTEPVEPGVAPDDEPEPLPEPLPLPVEPEPMPIDPPSFAAGMSIQLIDVSDRTAPAVIETTEIEGNHVDTRVVDGVARIVVTSYPQPPQFARAFDDMVDMSDIEAALDDTIDETTIDDWLPAFRTTTAAEDGAAPSSLEGAIVECDDVLVPEVNAGISETSILRVDFDSGFDPSNTTTIVADAGTVYASASTLYVAATQWVSAGDQGGISSEDWSTAVHAFDLGGDGAASHVAAGEVPGSTLNQYSLSEFDGHLRVATTEGTPWDGRDESESGVHVFEVQGGELVEVGSVGGLGRTETIQSVRFMGPVGYVVTFRQTDPLYVIDLSDPRSPQAVGELKIPGFSSYLHPVGEGRLLGIGRDADLEGRDQGFLISLFDVSDPTNPKQIQTHTEREAYSQAGNDPQAFLWWAPESAAILPMERFQEPTPNQPEGFGAGMTVFDVADSGITERGTVIAGGRYPSRAVVVQDQLWSLFDGGVVVSTFDDVANGTYHGFR
ncbi:beta-propeller domain-containing protein [Actinospongicola halichondriae]|uniref:beta-propeller domain-containing protein n=1 Tax=Actinospongicola halichondriae TaxID=3236844 RepID=UPI003D5127C0